MAGLELDSELEGGLHTFKLGAPALHIQVTTVLGTHRVISRKHDSVVMMVPDATSYRMWWRNELSFPCYFPPYRPYLSVLLANPPSVPLLLSKHGRRSNPFIFANPRARARI
jgi:hypothetical protein